MSQQESQAIVHTGHPTPGTYFKVALILSVITAIEVGIFYITALGKGIIPVLAVLSIAKFALVAMFYMHLKFDHKLFTTLFVAGLALATTVVFALISLFQFFV
ncbi:MAG: cytochrome C oxidase subunit IV family protein [Dehalococcoidia bacterium]|nr:cytochrome C oxidase subunit IV [Dehalococcoidia bacterium]MAX18827.1 cytochrome C oxidase subunit IV [Chloroflexota bacterium]MCD5399211.1 cytochrome C oxidase subunit IV family protein [Dehalococcoidia bacterium]|tara:strand:+ start:78 stop:386 length:309 start_codon:yes stop_codon:yes gene_type:complete